MGNICENYRALLRVEVVKKILMMSGDSEGIVFFLQLKKEVFPELAGVASEENT
jgi:hypothetical protein